MRIFAPVSIAMLAILLLLSRSTEAQMSVLTGEYGNGRTATNNAEFALSPWSISPTSFGKVGSYALDAEVTGQPLYVPGVQIGHGWVNALYVATQNNTVYALNADQPGSAPLWKVNLGPAVPTGYAGICPAEPMGVLSTPVIDAQAGVLYVVAAHPVAGQRAYKHSLYALSLGNGAQVKGGSVTINASVHGTGTDSSGGIVTMNDVHMIQRPALLLANGTVYLGFSGCGPDPSPYHGWILGYNANNVQQQTVVFNDTPNGNLGGIWQGGMGLVADGNGSVIFETGNGTFDDVTEFGESFVKISPTGSVQSWFTPSNALALSNADLDLSTTSPILTPDTNLVLGSGKQGLIYVLNASYLGNSGNAVQTFSGSTTACPSPQNGGCLKTHSLAYWNNLGASVLYSWPNADYLRAYTVNGWNGTFNPAPSSQGNQLSGYPGGILTVTSAFGVPWTGVVWALTPGELHAFNAMDVSRELWNSSQNGARDGLNFNYHFGQFTVANGRVYVPDIAGKVVVYGLL